MRFDLKVPFAEKDAAKKLGARWDAANRLWYVTGKADMSPFAKWAPRLREASGGAVAQAGAVAGKPQTFSSGKPVTGSLYRELPKVCECLPWEDCAMCRPHVPWAG